jgi:crossover junction endodeoxyribonuclease RusA
MIVLPWPDKILFPNKQKHWAAHSKAKQSYKHTCSILAHDLWQIKRDAKNTPVRIDFYPPDNRRRDLDNMLAAMKSGLDGIASAYGLDDYHFRPITIDVIEPFEGGKVVVFIG